MAIGGLISLLITLVVIGAILYVVWWAISQIPMVEPIRTVARVIFVLICLMIALFYLLPLLPGPHPFLR